MKKLYKSNTDQLVAGVLGGLGEYLEVDATLLRLGFILVAVLTGLFPAFIGYIIAAIIVPQKPVHFAKEATYTETPKAEPVKEEKKEETSN